MVTTRLNYAQGLLTVRAAYNRAKELYDKLETYHTMDNAEREACAEKFLTYVRILSNHAGFIGMPTLTSKTPTYYECKAYVGKMAGVIEAA